MPSRALRTAGIGVTALALATSLSTAAQAESRPLSAAASAPASVAAVTPQATCYDNIDNPGANIITSQNFEKSENDFDTAGADDVKLKKDCAVKSITVLGGYYPDSGPADSETVTFYTDRKGKPDKVFDKQTVTGVDNAGSFEIPLKKVSLKADTTYWVSVVVNMDVASNGQWGWLTSTKEKGKAALWRNAGDGFGTGCVKFSNMQDCTALTGQPDFAFALNK